MKAVGAETGDIKRIFFVESGRSASWAASAAWRWAGPSAGSSTGWSIISWPNRGFPYIEYFRFPLWLCLGAIAFAVGVSLVAGVYPALRAARSIPSSPCDTNEMIDMIRIRSRFE